MIQPFFKRSNRTSYEYTLWDHIKSFSCLKYRQSTNKFIFLLCFQII